ncbi:long-chain fatty acid--CoA ligase [Staphylococcus muscae]|uniref:Long chain fatty acid-CoA ligase n=1 Tax=Staphylococcus muscae TaxID=1294 RepID=A0A240BU26_9STAP|nr:AMP-binding protein [Staphylococcus muscae]AVQ34171.1 long-chain fatty acid--CoA ligase [Staphylococcus muscae]PNZ03478.1 long-chain fatty acid--CoA ligase [Staphylococcus muscae]GGA85533.1 long-chain-fatty-acid--CoA ligase [Staphylococcus muscae]SNV99205.1 long chain fatty acid-CoA ligase [Staphylococcus muscae]
MELLKRIAYYAEHQPYEVALYINQTAVTYEALWRRVQQAASLLPVECHACGVAVSFNNIEKFIISYLSLLYKGGVPCVMDPHWTKQRREALYEKYTFSYIWDDNGLRSTDYQGVRHDRDNLLHIGFTSGTTGLPNAFYRDEPSWIASFLENESLLLESDIQQMPVMVALGPYAHSLTLYVLIYALFYGRTFIGQDDYDVEQCQYAIQQFCRPSCLFLVPTMVHDWLHQSSLNDLKTYLFVSGDKLSVKLHHQLKTKFPAMTIYEFFGTSEASFISVNEDQMAPLQSVGRLFPSVEVRIDDQDAQGIGKLYVRSPMTFSGYMGEPVPKWIETGDYASIKEDILYLHGRTQDRMIIGGKNISPYTIEQTLKMIQGIDEVVIISQTHQKFGELALGLYEGDRQLTYREIRRQLERELSRYEFPSKLICVPKLPRTASGKISRRAAQLLCEQGAWQ